MGIKDISVFPKSRRIGLRELDQGREGGREGDSALRTSVFFPGREN